MEESAQRGAGHVFTQVQLVLYPKYGGLAGHRLTHCIESVSAKFWFVQTATQWRFTVKGSP